MYNGNSCVVEINSIKYIGYTVWKQNYLAF